MTQAEAASVASNYVPMVHRVEINDHARLSRHYLSRSVASARRGQYATARFYARASAHHAISTYDPRHARHCDALD